MHNRAAEEVMSSPEEEEHPLEYLKRMNLKMMMKIYESITTIQILEEVSQMFQGLCFNNLEDSHSICQLILTSLHQNEYKNYRLGFKVLFSILTVSDGLSQKRQENALT